MGIADTYLESDIGETGGGIGNWVSFPNSGVSCANDDKIFHGTDLHPSLTGVQLAPMLTH